MTTAFTVSGWLVAALVLTSGWRIWAVRREVVARACHELRGPLTCARLGLELAACEKRLPVARLRAIELGLSQATLALDDLQSSTRGRKPGWVDVVGVLADTVEAYRGGASSDRDVRLHAGPPIWVWGERVRLAQAAANLIANALEHGEQAVEVSIRAEAGWVRIEVADSGPGLPAAVAEFVRAADRGRRWRGGHPGRGGRSARRGKRWRGGHPGRGRGLVIAAAVAKAHGGSLIAPPSLRGARLVLRLPTRDRAPAPQQHDG